MGRPRAGGPDTFRVTPGQTLVTWGSALVCGVCRRSQVPRGPVTARNWQDPPYNRWAFWHVAEILPAYRVAHGPGPAPGPTAPGPTALPPAGLLDTAVTRLDGSADTVAGVLAGTFTDAYLVLQDGELVTEWYHPQGAADRNHALMSVSKSLVGCWPRCSSTAVSSTPKARSPVTFPN